MLFNSLQFVIFFPFCTILYFSLPHRFRWAHLLLASCIFYAAFIPAYLLILFLLIVIDYTAGLLIEKELNRKFWLVTSIIANMLLLGVFKYFDFFIININLLTGSNLLLLNWILPVGLSFHTFQSLSYTIEVYHRRQKAIKHPGYYALYVMFYPQLVAGPIERPQHLLPQFFLKQKFCSQKLYEGLRLMTWGFFKKLVIADRIGQFVDAVFNNPHYVSTVPVWLAVFFFSIQIYADFSGYSDIAIGAAHCMGFNLSINFNRPYQSRNIREFWKRWHISLSSWFRDYLYISLGGNRKGKMRKNLNLFITFIFSALWHGAGWTFILWGFLHWLYVLLYDWLKGCFKFINISNVIAWFITGSCVGFAWIIFRVPSLSVAAEIAYKSLNLNNVSFKNALLVPQSKIQFGNFSLVFSFCMIVYMFIIEKFTTPKLLNTNSKKIADKLLFACTVLLIIFFGMFQKSSFIYFQF
jgi:alginate O-acetyltransferase complex protein AlgI